MPSVKLNKTESAGVANDANYKRLEALKKAIPLIQKQLDEAAKEVDTRAPVVQATYKQALTDHTPANDPKDATITADVDKNGIVTLTW